MLLNKSLIKHPTNKIYLRYGKNKGFKKSSICDI